MASVRPPSSKPSILPASWVSGLKSLAYTVSDVSGRALAETTDSKERKARVVNFIVVSVESLLGLKEMGSRELTLYALSAAPLSIIQSLGTSGTNMLSICCLSERRLRIFASKFHKQGAR